MIVQLSDHLLQGGFLIKELRRKMMGSVMNKFYLAMGKDRKINKEILSAALNTYGKDPKEFLRFFAQKDEYGRTVPNMVLLSTKARGVDSGTSEIFKEVLDYAESNLNKNDLKNFVKSSNSDGTSMLHNSILYGSERETIHLLKVVKKAFADDKKSLKEFLDQTAVVDYYGNDVKESYNVVTAAGLAEKMGKDSILAELKQLEPKVHNVYERRKENEEVFLERMALNNWHETFDWVKDIGCGSSINNKKSLENFDFPKVIRDGGNDRLLHTYVADGCKSQSNHKGCVYKKNDGEPYRYDLLCSYEYSNAYQETFFTENGLILHPEGNKHVVVNENNEKIKEFAYASRLDDDAFCAFDDKNLMIYDMNNKKDKELNFPIYSRPLNEIEKECLSSVNKGGFKRIGEESVSRLRETYRATNNKTKNGLIGGR